MGTQRTAVATAWWALVATAVAPMAQATALAASPGAPVVAASPAPAPFLQRGERIPGQWIVTFDPDAPASDVRQARAAAVKRGATMRFAYTASTHGFAAVLDADALDLLRHDPAVRAVEPDFEVHVSGIQSPAPSWGLDRIDQAALPLSDSYTYAATGAGVTAYVLDTGIRTTHVDFGGRAVGGFSAIEDGRGTQDCNGHGTHVAGTIGGATYGVAKSVKLVAVRVLDCTGSGPMSGVIAGVDWVTAHHQGPSVANLSLGGAPSAALDEAVARSIASGVTYAVAAGNDNVDACNQSPARLPAALTVGASTKTDTRADFSNYGSCVDLFAPGQSIRSDLNTGDTAVGVYSGTSMATPHVAGVVATYLASNPGATPAQVNDALIRGTRLQVLGDIGPGSLNRLLGSVVPVVAGPSATAPRASAPRRVPAHKSRIPVRVTWAAYAAESRTIASVQLQRSRDGGKTWATVRVAVPTANSAVLRLADGAWRFRVRVRDSAGSASPWATGPRVVLLVKQHRVSISEVPTTSRPAGSA